MPIPPSCDMQIAVWCFVTVSIVALSKGMLHSSVWVILLFTETSPGSTLEYQGRKRTSSKVKLSSIRYFSIFAFIDDFNYEGCLKSHKLWTSNKSKYQTCLRVLRKRDSVFRYLLIPLFPDHYQVEDELRWNDNFFHVWLSSIYKICHHIVSKNTEGCYYHTFSVSFAILWWFFASRDFSILYK